MAETKIVPLNHLVIIPDGNRRWSKSSGLPVWEGHRRSSNNLQYILEVCKEREIHYLTMWGFSTENWKRDQDEVKFLMDLFSHLLSTKLEEFIKNEINFRHLGRKDRLPESLLKLIEKAEKETAKFDTWHYQVALDYGGRDEILRATNKIIEDVKAGKIDGQVTDEKFASYLDTAGVPDPDLILRTSGEKRLSGMMPFQGVYAELEFTDMRFPEMTKESLNELIEEYYNRQRRFGAG